MSPPSTLPEDVPTSSSSTASTSPESGQTDSSSTADFRGARNKRLGRENAQEKGKRLLVTGRLRVLRVEDDLIVATCKGDSGGLYHLGYDGKRRQWRCTCEARGPCSHLHALWAVTAVER